MKQVQNYMAEIALGNSSLDLLLVRVTLAVAVAVEVAVVMVALLQLQSGVKMRSPSTQYTATVTGGR